MVWSLIFRNFSELFGFYIFRSYGIFWYLFRLSFIFFGAFPDSLRFFRDLSGFSILYFSKFFGVFSGYFRIFRYSLCFTFPELFGFFEIFPDFFWDFYFSRYFFFFGNICGLFCTFGTLGFFYESLSDFLGNLEIFSTPFEVFSKFLGFYGSMQVQNYKVTFCFLLKR